MRAGPAPVRLLLAAVAVWAVAAATLLALAYLDVRRGAEAADRARRQATAGGVLGRGAERDLARAGALFDRARRRSGGVVTAPLRVLPVAGRQLRSFSTLAGAAGRVADVGTRASAAARQLLRHSGSGPERVVALGRLGTLLRTTGETLAQVDLGPGDRALVAPLASRRRALEERRGTAVEALARGATTADTLARVLGRDQRYLFLAANNAEMRAGSGMFLEAGILEVRRGALSLGPLRPTPELILPGEGIPAEGDLGGRWGWLRPGRDWRNLGLSPRFDSTGPLAARMWTGLTGERVDGVVAVDVDALRAVLAATGPVGPPDAPVGADRAADWLLHDQYVAFAGDNAARRDQLGRIASAAVAAVEGGRYDAGRLAVGLARAARGRHVLAWSADAGDQAGWLAAGVGGAMEPNSLLVSVLNRGGNKLDRFLEVRNRVEARVAPGGREVAVHVRLRNTTPPGEPPYVAGPHPDSGVGEGVYLGMVSVNVPGAALDVRVDGEPPLLAAGPDGATRVVAVPVALPRGDEGVVVVRFRLPSPAVVRVEPSARLPAAEWQAGASRWRDEAARVVAW